MKNRFDKEAVVLSFKPGDQVLVPLPIPGSALSTRFSGPYVVKSVGSSMLVYGVPETRVLFESQFIVDNKEYKHGITNNVIFFSRSAPLRSPLCSVQFLIPHYLMTPLTNYNSGSHSFTGGPPKLSIFLFCRTVFSTP